MIKIKFKFKQEHKVHLLVVGAILSLVVFGSLYLFGQFLFFGNMVDESLGSRSTENINGYQEGDPLITRIPSLEDIIDGPIITPSDPSIGSDKAKVNLVQFSDFTCSYCQKQEEIISVVMKKYGDKVRLIRKDYPQKDIKTMSYQAALAARCAQQQGKFWEYHKELFKYGEKMNENTFTHVAEILKLDSQELAQCIKSGETKVMVDNNIEEGDALQINGVPFLYVNKQEVLGEINTEDLQKMIDVELNRGGGVK